MAIENLGIVGDPGGIVQPRLATHTGVRPIASNPVSPGGYGATNGQGSDPYMQAPEIAGDSKNNQSGLGGPVGGISPQGGNGGGGGGGAQGIASGMQGMGAGASRNPIANLPNPTGMGGQSQFASAQPMAGNQGTGQSAQGNNPFLQIQQQSNNNVNPFMQPVKNSMYGEFQKQQAGGWTNSFIDGVEAFNRQFGRMAEGVLGLGNRIGQMFGGGKQAQQFGADLDNLTKQNDLSLQQAQQRSPIATTIGSIAGAAGSATAYGGGAPMSLANSAAGKILGTGAVSAAQAAVEPGTPEEKMRRAAIAGTVGTAIPAVGIGAKKAIQSGAGAVIDSELGQAALNKFLGPYASTVTSILSTAAGRQGLEELAAKTASGVASSGTGLLNSIKDTIKYIPAATGNAVPSAIATGAGNVAVPPTTAPQNQYQQGQGYLQGSSMYGDYMNQGNSSNGSNSSI